MVATVSMALSVTLSEIENREAAAGRWDRDVTMDLIATPATIAAGETARIAWSSSNARSCQASGAWSGTRSASGEETVSPASNATYELTCSSRFSSATETVTISVTPPPPPPPPPTVSLAASPVAIVEGTSSTLTWSSTHASDCQASGAWSGPRAASGSTSVSPIDDATYTLECTSEAGSATDSVTIDVTAGPVEHASLHQIEEASLLPPMAAASDGNALGGVFVSPTAGSDSTSPSREAALDFSVPASGVYYLWARLHGANGSGDALYVGIDDTWDRVFPSAHGVYEWVAVESAAGTREFDLTAGSHVFQVGHGEIGARIDAVYLTHDPVDVPTFAPDPTPEAPTVSLAVNPGTVEIGESATLSWSSSHADSCDASGDWSGARSPTGSQSVSPDGDRTYTLTCDGAGGSASATAALTVTIPPPPTVALSASPTEIEIGESATLSWSSQEATGCEASGGWSGSRAATGSASVSPASDAIYTLLCSGPGGSSSDSVSIVVSEPPPPPGGDDPVDLPRGGWGSDVVAGDDKPVCTVSNLADSGFGSLRSCLVGGHVLVRFAVEGTISCNSTLDVEAYTTVDGSSAPGTGITVQGCMIRMAGSGAHDIRLRGFRVRGSGGDNLQIQEGAHHIHVTRMSLGYCGDGNLDVTRGAHHVTVDHSILLGCGKNMLIADTVENYGDLHSIAIHRNVFVDNQWRNPWVSVERDGGTGPGTSVHFEGNVVWGWGDNGGGIGSECGSVVNVEKNLFQCNDAGTCSTSRQRNHVIVKSQSTCDDPRVYTSGNHSGDPSGSDPDGRGNVSLENPRPVPDVPPVTDWCTAAHEAVSTAGARPLDGVDQDHLATITLPSCS